jgi:hypothetical protein
MKSDALGRRRKGAGPSRRLPLLRMHVAHIIFATLEPTMSTAEIYTILCIIQEQSRAFSVEIASDKIVDQLKKAIKMEKSNMLTRVDADTLDLYHVSIRTHDEDNIVTNYVRKSARRNEQAAASTRAQPGNRTGSCLQGSSSKGYPPHHYSTSFRSDFFL